MCDGDCTEHGTVIYIPAGHSAYIYPNDDPPQIVRGSD